MGLLSKIPIGWLFDALMVLIGIIGVWVGTTLPGSTMQVVIIMISFLFIMLGLRWALFDVKV